VPAALQRLVRRSWSSPPNWLRTDTLRRIGVTIKPDPYIGGRLGQKYHRWLAMGIAGCQRGEEARALGEVVSVRHPFLYRPLVEFALGLPPEFCARPHAHKWVLREAMKGIVPELVRTRVLKGGGGDSLPRMFIHQGALLKQLAHDPILADLGLIDARRLQTAVEEASNRETWRASNWGEIVKTLTIEAWLQVRSGRWPHGFAMPQAPSVPRQDTYQLTATQRRSI
jgi:hypothetical protein